MFTNHPRTFGQDVQNIRSQTFKPTSAKTSTAGTIPAAPVAVVQTHHHHHHQQQQLLATVHEARTQTKELERFVSKYETAFRIQPSNNRSMPPPPLVHRLSSLLDQIVISSTSDVHRPTPQPAQPPQPPQPPQPAHHPQYHPPKMSLTTFATCTPRQFGGQQIGESTTLVARPAWVPDNAQDTCSGCGSVFGIFSNRRHHCRACGGLFDTKCCDQKVKITRLKYDRAVLVCKFCLPKVVQDNHQEDVEVEVVPPAARGVVGPLMPRFNGTTNSVPQWHGETKENQENQENQDPAGPDAWEVHQEQHRVHQEQQRRQREEAASRYRLQQQQEEEAQERRKSANLRHVERERNAFVQRRKKNAGRIDELKNEVLGARGSAAAGSPSSGSDCGSVVDMQFV